MTDRVAAELMDDTPDGVYAVAGIMLVGAAAAALVGLPDRRADLVVGIVALGIVASISGWLFARRGYRFVEGWFAGVLFFPLAIAFGIWGPSRPGSGR